MNTYRPSESPAVEPDRSADINLRDPLSVLPIELMQNILAFTRPLQSGSWTEANPLVDGDLEGRTHLRPGLVSRQWRDVALQTPELWSTIRGFQSLGPDDWAQYLELHLQRSAQMPLEIVLDTCQLPTSDPKYGLGQELYERILLESHRWRRCYIVLPMYPDTDWDRLPATLPILEELVVVPEVRQARHVDDDEDIPDGIWPRAIGPARLLGNAPHLKRLSFHAIYSAQQPLCALEYLSINMREDAPNNRIWNILDHTGGLRELRIFWPLSEHRQGGRPERDIHLPKLERLEIYGHVCTDFRSWADKLKLPSLHTIVASAYTCYVLDPLFVNVASQVKMLILRYEAGSQLATPDAQAIRLISGLETLYIRGQFMHDDDLGGFDATSAHRIRFWNFFPTLKTAMEEGQLPNLKKLVIENCWKPWSFTEEDQEPVLLDFELTFGKDAKGWDDERLDILD